MVAIGAAAAVLALRRSPIVAGCAVGAVLGAAVAGWHVWGLHRGPVAALAAHRAEVDVIGRLVRDPVTTTTDSGGSLTLVDLTVISVLRDGWRPTHAPVLVLSYGTGWAGLLPGQRVEITGRLAPPRRGDDVAAVLDARAPPYAMGRPPWWQRAAGRVRGGLRDAAGSLPPDERGLLPGLVDGDVAAEPPPLTADMRLTGLTHLQAVSGENVSVVLGVVLALARSLGMRRRGRVVLSALALLAFVVLARPSPSVLRAAVMGGVSLLGLAAGRRIGAVPAIGFAVIVLVLTNPFLGRSVGFVLSVCATSAIVLVAPRWTDRLATSMPRPLATAIAVPAAAQLACTPVLVLVFGQLTPYAVLANLLAAPAVVPATVIGVCCAGAAMLWHPGAVSLAWVAAGPTWVIAQVAHLLAALPGAGLRAPTGPLALCAYAAIAAGLICRRAIAQPPATSRAHNDRGRGDTSR